VETPEIRVRCYCRDGHPATVVHRVCPIQSRGLQADGHTGTAATPPATDRRLPDHIVRASHTQVGDARRLLAVHRYPITGRTGCRQVRFRPAGVCAVIARGPETSAGVLVRSHGAVVHSCGGHPQSTGHDRHPVVPVWRHAVRVQQFRWCPCVPVDDDM